MNHLEATLNRLCKWRTVFASWQLGTRAKTDPECQAVTDHRESTILLRVEVSALARLMLDKGVFTQAELEKQLLHEANHLDEMYQRRFPGFQATDYGLSIDPQVAQHTMKGWRP